MMDDTDPRLRLLVITDDLRDGIEGLVARASAAARGGATMLLLRLKHADARTLLEAARALVAALPIPVLVSERLDVALASGAAGVHLSATSMPVVAVRLQAPAGFLIGGSVSEANDLPRVVGADFVTIGPVFGSGDQTLGLEAFTRLARGAGVPAIAVGGVDAGNAAQARGGGAAGVAVIRTVLASQDIEASAHALAAAMA